MRKNSGEERRVVKMISQRQGAEMKVSSWFCSYSSKLTRNTGEGDGDEFNSLGEGDGERGRQFRNERSVEAKSSGPFFRQQQSQGGGFARTDRERSPKP